MNWKRISRERYDEMLGALPPELRLTKGFLTGEAVTHETCTIAKIVVPKFRPFVQTARDAFYEGEKPMSRGEFRILDLHKVE